MSVKSLKRQLAAAIVMVLVAIIALGSSTFAWFANNTKVTAEGMSITALSEGANLEISWADSSDAWTANAGKTTIGNTEATRDSATIAATELLPTHYVTGTETAIDYDGKDGIDAGDWIHTFSNKYAEVGQADYSVGDVLTKVEPYAIDGSTKAVTAKVTDGKQYALVVPIYLRMNPNSGVGIADLRATATITQSDAGTTGKGMETAARVAYIVNGNLIGTAGGYATGDESATLGEVKAPVSGTSEVLTVYAVIYIDGDDPSCTSQKFDTDKYAVSISFAEYIAPVTP